MSQFKYLLTNMAGDKIFQFYLERLSLDEFPDQNFVPGLAQKFLLRT